MSKAVSRAHPSKTNGLVQDLRKIFERTVHRKRTVLAEDGAIKAREQDHTRVSKARSDVVSESLCDDVLSYLAPTLEPYKGCTVIDIFPGPGLWSSKLHEFLKPKRHILLEPEDRYAKRFLRPLLEKKDSKYLHSNLPGAIISHFEKSYDELFGPDGLLPREHLDPDDPRLRSIDTSILLTGNLSQRSDRKFHGRLPTASKIAARGLSWSSLVNGTVHRQGLVRMLLWAPEAQMATLLPSKHVYRNTTEAQLNLAMSPAVVTGVENDVKSSRSASKTSSSIVRYSGFERGSAERVQKRMLDTGMAVPDGRSIYPMLPISSVKSKIPERTPMLVRFSTLEALEDALQRLQTRWQDLLKAKIFAMPPSRGNLANTRQLRHFFSRLHYPELIDAIIETPNRQVARQRRVAAIAAAQSREKENPEVFESKSEASGNKQQQVDDKNKSKTSRKRPAEAERRLTISDMKPAILADMLLRAVNLEVHVRVFEEAGHDMQDLKARLLALEHNIYSCQGMEELNGMFGRDVCRLLEEWLGYFATPPILHIDRRPYEPLQSEPEDFYPHSAPLSLFDFVPVERDLVVPGIADRSEVARTGEALIKYLFSIKSQPLTIALDRLAANAAQDLIPMVPAITDPRKGGRLDPKYLKVRQLTEEMLEGLIKAWFEWPFRPQSWEVAVNFERAKSEDTALERGEAVVDSGDVEEDV